MNVDDAKTHCKFWINTGRCEVGDLCKFLHVGPEELKQERKKWLADRIHQKRLRAHHEEDPNHPHG